MSSNLCESREFTKESQKISVTLSFLAGKCMNNVLNRKKIAIFHAKCSIFNLTAWKQFKSHISTLFSFHIICRMDPRMKIIWQKEIVNSIRLSYTFRQCVIWLVSWISKNNNNKKFKTDVQAFIILFKNSQITWKSWEWFIIKRKVNTKHKVFGIIIRACVF